MDFCSLEKTTVMISFSCHLPSFELYNSTWNYSPLHQPGLVDGWNNEGHCRDIHFDCELSRIIILLRVDWLSYLDKLMAQSWVLEHRLYTQRVDLYPARHTAVHIQHNVAVMLDRRSNSVNYRGLLCSFSVNWLLLAHTLNLAAKYLHFYVA